MKGEMGDGEMGVYEKKVKLSMTRTGRRCKGGILGLWEIGNGVTYYELMSNCRVGG